MMIRIVQFEFGTLNAYVTINVESISRCIYLNYKYQDEFA